LKPYTSSVCALSLDAYFFFGGFHLLFSVYMIIGIPSTGSAGLINMVAAYTRGSIAAGVFCTVATVGWVIQGLGNAFYYRIVSTKHDFATVIPKDGLFNACCSRFGDTATKRAIPLQKPKESSHNSVRLLTDLLPFHQFSTLRITR